MKTRTLPDEQRGAWFEGSDVITMLSVYGTALTFDLPREAKTFTIGSSPDRDIAVPTEFLSALHCVLERRDGKLRVHDQSSKNGTYFHDRREAVFDVHPGDTFTAGSIRFLAMNDEMRAAHPVLVDLLGGEDEHVLRVSSNMLSSPSDVLVAAAHGSHILITGEPGCDHARVARTIHDISLLRARAPVSVRHVPDERARQREMLDNAARSTLILEIDAKTPVMDAAFASAVFSPEQHIRVIALAPSITRANQVLGDPNVRDMRLVSLQPLARRQRMIPRLLDRLLVDRGIALRTADLTPKNQAALQSYDWPHNFDDLRLAADRIDVLAREGTLRKTAEVLGMSVSTFHYWFNAVGLSLPLLT